MTDFLAEISPATEAFEAAVEAARTEIDELKAKLAEITELFEGLSGEETAEIEAVKSKYIQKRKEATATISSLTERVTIAESAIKLNEIGLAALKKAELAIRGSVPVDTVITALDEEVDSDAGNVLQEGAEKILQKCGISRPSPDGEEDVEGSAEGRAAHS